jgi:hypothetical protein
MDIASLQDQQASVTAVNGATPMTMTSPPPTAALHGTLSGIAQQLGMSVSGVQSAIKQGASIADLAQQQGVPTGSIVQSIEAQVQKSRQANGQAPLDPSTLDRMVTRAVNHHRHGGHAMGTASAAPVAGTGAPAGSTGSTGSTASSPATTVSPTTGSGGSSFSALA